MKKITNYITVLLVATIMFVTTGCGQPKVINGVKYETYGLLNESTSKNENIEYKLSVGNVVWSILLCETVVMPVYFIGFSIYNPVGVKGQVVKGTI